MFTGIIQEIGRVVQIMRFGRGARILIQAPQILKDVKIGDSIATNGVCLTITELNGDVFTADISPETLKRTYLAHLKSGDPVNLEPALRLGDRLGGHLVTGHIDGAVRLTSCVHEGDFTTFSFNIPPKWYGRIVYKGSATVDGVSLTVADCRTDRVSMALIPQTLYSTSLRFKKTGDPVHIELDIIGRYIEGLLVRGDIVNTMKKSGINEGFLIDCGY